MVTPLEKFLAKHPTPSGMDSKEWAALNAAMKENKFFSSKVENIRLLERLHRLIKNYLTGEKETLPRHFNGSKPRGLFHRTPKARSITTILKTSVLWPV